MNDNDFTPGQIGEGVTKDGNRYLGYIIESREFICEEPLFVALDPMGNPVRELLGDQLVSFTAWESPDAR